MAANHKTSLGQLYRDVNDGELILVLTPHNFRDRIRFLYAWPISTSRHFHDGKTIGIDGGYLDKHYQLLSEADCLE